MKFKSLFIAALAILAFSACDKKKDDVKPKAMHDGVVRVHLSVAPAVRAIQDVVTQGTKSSVRDLTLYFLTATDDVVFSKRVAASSTELTDLQTAPGKEYEVPTSVERVAIVANSSAPVHTTDPLNLAAINAQVFDLVTENHATDGIKYVTLLGNATAKVPASAPATAIPVANVKLIPLPARIESNGAIVNSPKMTNFKVKFLYADNYKTKFNDATSLVNLQTKGTTPGTVTVADLATATYILKDEIAPTNEKVINNRTKVSAFQVFAGEKPTIIAELSYTYNGNDLVKYIVLQKFNDGTDVGELVEIHTKPFLTAGTSPITLPASTPGVLVGGNVYKLDLSKVDWNGDGKYIQPVLVDPDKPYNPDPEDPGYNPLDPDKPQPEDVDILTPDIPTDKPYDSKKKIGALLEVQGWNVVPIIPSLK